MKKEKLIKIAINKKSYYNKIEIPKKGGTRTLQCLTKFRGDKNLYTIQKKLKNNFFDKIPIANNVFGFVNNYSYRDYLEVHVNKENSKKFYLRLDIKDFFDFICNDLIKEVISYYVKEEKTLNLILDLVTLNDSLPQGAVTSPVLSNIIFRQLDIRIQRYCRELNIQYSRYADDMLFSSHNKQLHNVFFIKMLKKILSSKGFKINYEKIIKTKEEISLNGFVVGNCVRLSRKRTHDVNKLLFIYEKMSKQFTEENFITELNKVNFIYRNKYDTNFKNIEDVIQYLSGFRSFMIQWLPENKQSKYYKKHQKIIKRIENLLLKLR